MVLPVCLAFLAVGLLAMPEGAQAATTYTERFTVVNNCADNAWMWVVPPGPDTAEEQSQFWETVNGGTRVCKDDSDPCATRNYQWKIEIAAGATKNFKIPDQGSASNKLYFNLGCQETSGTFKEWGNCIIGGEFGVTTLGNDLTSSNTWFEATWGCNDSTGATCVPNPSKPSEKLGDQDWLDLSLVDGYTVPIKLELGTGEASAKNCIFQSGSSWNGIEDLGFVDFNSCPTETSATMYSENSAISGQLSGDGINLLSTSNGNQVNCAAPHAWLSGNVLGTQIDPSPRPLIAGTTPGTLNATNWYGCKGTCGETAGNSNCVCPECGKSQCLKGPFGNGTYTVAETAYVKRLKAMGVESYTWQYDDEYGLKHCDQGATVTLTLCPELANQKPYDPAQSWNYDSSSGQCTLVASGGTYSSYFACITKHSKYSQRQEVAANNRKVIHCFPNEGGSHTSYSECVEPDLGQADVWWRKAENGNNGVWFMNGDAVVGAKLVHEVSSMWELGCLADFNSDGESDAFWHSAETGNSVIQYLNDTTVSHESTSVNIPAPWSIGACADFDQDGQTDVFWNNPQTGRNGVTYLQSNGSLKGDYGFLNARSTQWLPRGSADFNGDSKPDMVFRNSDTGQVAIMLLDNLATQGVHMVTTISTEWDIKGVGDFNNDSNHDLLWRNGTTGENGVMYMNGIAPNGHDFIETVAPQRGWDIAGTCVLH